MANFSGNERARKDAARRMAVMNTTHDQLRRDKPYPPTYNSWKAMRQRCRDTNAENYERYGGRGIKVCDRWNGRDGYANFLADMGERPAGMSIDRLDVNGDYAPANCRWATDDQQRENTRRRSKAA